MNRAIELIAVVFLSLYSFICNSQCSNAVTNAQASSKNETSIGTIAWSSPSNATASDNLYATVTASPFNDTSNYLLIDDFGFNLPVDAIVCGIEVEIERNNSFILGSAQDLAVKIVKNGVITGSNLASVDIWPSSDNKKVYGGDMNAWGESWTYSDINSSSFGLAIAVKLSQINLLPEAKIDNMTATVYYDSATALPISLVDFTAERIRHDAVEVAWTTSSEINNSHFTIERSLNGSHWEAIGEFKGSGNSNKQKNYYYMDYNISSKNSYYRLKQTDFNGAYKYFSPALVKNASRQLNGITVYPIPILNGELTVEAAQEILSIELISIHGSLLFKKEFYCQNRKEKISLGELIKRRTPYFLKVTKCDQSVEMKKIL